MKVVKPSVPPQIVANSTLKPTSVACDRRLLLASFLATAAQAGISASPSESAALTPYQRGFNLEYGLQADGRIRRCDAGAQPNCVSTSSLTDLYLPPWSAAIQDPETAMEVRLRILSA